jgi:hypothetical protein
MTSRPVMQLGSRSSENDRDKVSLGRGRTREVYKTIVLTLVAQVIYTRENSLLQGLHRWRAVPCFGHL